MRSAPPFSAGELPAASGGLAYDPYFYANEVLRVLYRSLGMASHVPRGRAAQMDISVPAPCPDCGGFHDDAGNPTV